MKAAVLNAIPGQLGIEDVEIGEPGPREALITTKAAGLCHSDLHFMEGKYPYPCPAVLGRESAGVVEAIGSMVTYVQSGDHVITCLSAFCGHRRGELSRRPPLGRVPGPHLRSTPVAGATGGLRFRGRAQSIAVMHTNNQK